MPNKGDNFEIVENNVNNELKLFSLYDLVWSNIIKSRPNYTDQEITVDFYYAN